jgi:4-hydroxy-tetrahydrodipicolinate synthase
MINMPSGPSLSGVLPVFQTPFHEDESIDFETLEKEITWLYDQGSQGIVMALVSEMLRLSGEERRQLAEAACRFGRDRGAVIISVGAESSHTAVAYARQAESVGAAAVMAIPPLSLAAAPDELIGYYERIINAVQLPVIVQDAGSYVGQPLPVELQVRLFNEYGSRIMFKPETAPVGPRLSALRQATGGQAAIFEGSGGMLLVENYRRGISGTMPGADLIDGIVGLWQALAAGDEGRIYRLSLPITALVGLLPSLDAFLAVEKYLLVKRGIFKNSIVRGPVGYRLDPDTRREVDRLFDQLQMALADKDSR